MKKIYALTALMMTSLCIMGQSMKVQANFAKGEYAIYESTSKAQMASPQGEEEAMNATGEIKYEVTEANKDGYTIAITTQKWDNGEEDTSDAGLLNNFSNLFEEFVVGQTTILSTNKDGKVLGIKNYEEMKKYLETLTDSVLDKIFGAAEASSLPLKKENFKDMMMDQLTEENILQSVLHSSNQFSLYGKTIATGVTEDEMMNGMKMKTTYFVMPQKSADHYTIKSSSVINMEKEDIKKLVIDNVKKIMPEQADMVVQNIDMLLDSGMLKFEGSRTCTYTFLPNGWLQEAEMTQKTNSMGSESTVTNTWKIKECSWK
ncbi:MAG: hypothetical protein J5529_07055 [Prevotella sp.]|nr:hypothetical protein [Prevotella sp.]